MPLRSQEHPTLVLKVIYGTKSYLCVDIVIILLRMGSNGYICSGDILAVQYFTQCHFDLSLSRMTSCKICVRGVHKGSSTNYHYKISHPWPSVTCLSPFPMDCQVPSPTLGQLVDTLNTLYNSRCRICKFSFILSLPFYQEVASIHNFCSFKMRRGAWIFVSTFPCIWGAETF